MKIRIGAEEMRAQEIDPIMSELLRNRLDSITDEMETVLFKSSYLSIIREALGTSAVIFDSQARNLAQAGSLPGRPSSDIKFPTRD